APHTIKNWFLIKVPPQQRNAAAVQALIADWAGQNVAPFVSPVFVDDLGGPLIVTPDLLVQFADTVTPANAEAILAQIAPRELLNRDWDGMINAYRVRTSFTVGFHVLRAANTLAQMAEVRFA